MFAHYRKLIISKFFSIHLVPKVINLKENENHPVLKRKKIIH